jgi:pimeloyl-ACP methyl ester carboxylesterase
MAQTTTSTLTTPDSITWHIERTGSGPNHLILIPDGLGDAGLFSRAIPVLGEAEEFTITTFDMPGMCRSNKAPESTYTDVTPQKLAQYIVTLMDALEIKVASFWGCSSGGSTVLALIAHHPERVKSAMAHEVPTYAWPDLLAFETMSDKDICDTLETMLPKGMMGPNVDAWFGMGEEFHARLRKNYPLWVGTTPCLEPSSLLVQILIRVPLLCTGEGISEDVGECVSG